MIPPIGQVCVLSCPTCRDRSQRIWFIPISCIDGNFCHPSVFVSTDCLVWPVVHPGCFRLANDNNGLSFNDIATFHRNKRVSAHPAEGEAKVVISTNGPRGHVVLLCDPAPTAPLCLQEPFEDESSKGHRCHRNTPRRSPLRESPSRATWLLDAESADGRLCAAHRRGEALCGCLPSGTWRSPQRTCALLFSISATSPLAKSSQGLSIRSCLASSSLFRLSWTNSHVVVSHADA